MALAGREEAKQVLIDSAGATRERERCITMIGDLAKLARAAMPRGPVQSMIVQHRVQFIRCKAILGMCEQLVGLVKASGTQPVLEADKAVVEINGKVIEPTSDVEFTSTYKAEAP
jgi:hypothetical protein